MGDLVVVAAFWTIVGLIVFIGARRRTSSFRRLASRLGLEHRHGSFDLGSYPIPLFDRGTDRGVRDAMLGTWKGEEVVVLDFWYRPTYLPRADRQNYLCALVRIPSHCPPTEIEHVSVASQLADLVAAQRVVTGLAPFDKRYRVQSADRRFASVLLAPSVIDFLLEFDWPMLHFELGGMYAACASSDRDIDLIRRMPEFAREFRSSIPAVAYDAVRGKD